jgi:hypothetical protein
MCLYSSWEDMMKTALARLRAKTDRDLGVLIRRELDRSIALAKRGNNRAAAEGYALASGLLVVTDIPAADRVRLEQQLRALRGVVELPATAVA